MLEPLHVLAAVVLFALCCTAWIIGRTAWRLGQLAWRYLNPPAIPAPIRESGPYVGKRLPVMVHSTPTDSLRLATLQRYGRLRMQSIMISPTLVRSNLSTPDADPPVPPSATRDQVELL